MARALHPHCLGSTLASADLTTAGDISSVLIQAREQVAAEVAERIPSFSPTITFTNSFPSM